MKHYKLFITLGIIVFISFLLCISGIRNELPSSEIKKLLFSDNDTIALLIPQIVETRRSDKDYTDNLRKYKRMEIGGRYYMNLPDDYILDMERENEIILLNRKLFISKNKFKWMGNYLIASSYPDEQGIIHAISRFKLRPFDLNTHLLGYGGAYIYPLAAIIKLNSALKVVKLSPDRVQNMMNPDNVQKIFVIGKLFGIFSFMFSIIMIYFTGKSLYKSKLIGLLSAVFLGFNPVLIITSHYLKPWIYSIFWVILCLYFSSQIQFDNLYNNKKIYFFSAIAAGLAMGSVFSAGYIFLTLILFHLYTNKIHKMKLLLYSILVFLLTYIITNPYHLISFPEFLDSFSYTQETWFSKVKYLDITTYIKNFTDIIYTLGIPLTVSILCGGLIAVIKRRKEDIILWLCILFYYFINFKIVSANFPDRKYLVPLIPILIIMGARFLGFLYENKNIKYGAILITVLMMLNFFMYSLFYVFKFTTVPKIEAGDWINKNVPSGSTIGTWIDKDGYRNGYPPFNYLSYRFINDWNPDLNRIINEKPEYYLAIITPYWKEPFFANNKLWESYREIKSFKSKVPFLLSLFYSNQLLYFWVEEIKLYKRI